MFSDILIPFLAILLAELGDKTQLAVLILATKTKRRAALAAGVLLAFLLVDGLAVLTGSWGSRFLHPLLLRIVSGSLFILFGIWMLRNQGDKEEVREAAMKSPFLSGFTVIFLSELGDKTQIAAGVFAVKYQPALVLIGTMAALTLLSLTAIYIGRLLVAKINQQTVSKIGGAIFLILGISMIFWRA